MGRAVSHHSERHPSGLAVRVGRAEAAEVLVLVLRGGLRDLLLVSSEKITTPTSLQELGTAAALAAQALALRALTVSQVRLQQVYFLTSALQQQQVAAAEVVRVPFAAEEAEEVRVLAVVRAALRLH